MLLSFSNVVYGSPAQRQAELWRVAKDGRELRCLAVYMPTGIDLRLMEGEDSGERSCSGTDLRRREGGGLACEAVGGRLDVSRARGILFALWPA